MYKHLYDSFKHWYDGGTIYFYSDPHFADDEMKYLRKNYIGDDEQVKRINSKIGKNDCIIFLGDIGDVEFIRKIKGYKVLVMGNHDVGASKYKKTETMEVFDKSKYSAKELRELLNKGFPNYNCHFYEAYSSTGEKWFVDIDNGLFDEVYEGPLMISDKILLSHEPIDLPFIFNIHGHDHSNTQCKDDRHINLCAENIGYRPVGIKEIVNTGKIGKVDSIHRTTIDKATEKKKKRENDPFLKSGGL